MRNPSFGGIKMRGDAGALIGYVSEGTSTDMLSTSSLTPLGSDHGSTLKGGAP